MSKKGFKNYKVLASEIEAEIKSMKEIQKSIATKTGLLRKTRIKEDSKVKKSLLSISKLNFYPKLPNRINYFFSKAQAYSYRNARNFQQGIIENSSISPPSVINIKEHGVIFAKSIGLECPDVQFNVDLEKVDFKGGKVVKPMYSDGGKCIFAIINSNEEYKDLFSGEVFESKKILLEYIEKNRADRKIAKQWLSEEMVVGKNGLPTEVLDVKFYTFYGEVGLVLQVDRWGKEKKYDFFTPEGGICNTGKYTYDVNAVPRFDSGLINLAKNASLMIPWPHVRIDFLVSDLGVKFGEFTLRPGGAASFNDEVDRSLGVLYQKAFSRLYNDMLNGKKFYHYTELIDKVTPF